MNTAEPEMYRGAGRDPMEPKVVLVLGGVPEWKTRTWRYRVHAWVWEHGLRQCRNTLIRLRGHRAA